MLIIADNQPLTRDALASYFGNQSVHFAMSKDEVSHLLQQTPTGSVILDFSLFDFSTPEHMLIYLRRFPQSHWFCFQLSLPKICCVYWGANHK